MTPFSTFMSVENFSRNDSGVPLIGGMSKYDEYSIPMDRYALVYFTSANITNGPVTLSVLSKTYPELALKVTGTNAALAGGDIPGTIFLPPGDVLQWRYETNEPSSFATLTFSMVLFAAK